MTIGANQFDDKWSSGAGRFDNLMLTIKKALGSSFKLVAGVGVLAGIGVVMGVLMLVKEIQAGIV